MNGFVAVLFAELLSDSKFAIDNLNFSATMQPDLSNNLVYALTGAPVQRTRLSPEDDEKLVTVVENWRKSLPAPGGVAMLPFILDFPELLLGKSEWFLGSFKKLSVQYPGWVGVALTDNEFMYLAEVMIILGSHKAFTILYQSCLPLGPTIAAVLDDRFVIKQVARTYQPNPAVAQAVAYYLGRKEILKELLPPSSYAAPSHPFIPSLRLRCEILVAHELIRNRSVWFARVASLPDPLLAKVMYALSRAAQPLSYQVLWDCYAGLEERAHHVVDIRTLVHCQQKHDFCLRETIRARVASALPWKSMLLPVFDASHIGLFTYSPKESLGEARLATIFGSHSATRPFGQRSICESREEFQIRFAQFSRDQLRFLNWKNIAVIGGAVTACLMADSSKADSAFASSDIDLCFYGDSDKTLAELIKELHKAIVQADPAVPVSVLASGDSFSFVRGYPYRTIQILGIFDSLDDIMNGIDIDCNAVCYTGTEVYAMPRACIALNYRMNVVDPQLQMIRGCPQFELRLIKYAMRGFSIGDLTLHRSRYRRLLAAEDPPPFPYSFSYQRSAALCTPGVGQKLLLQAEKHKTVREVLLGAATPSIPYGPEWTAKRLLEYFRDPSHGNTLAAELGIFDGYTPHRHGEPHLLEQNWENSLTYTHLAGNETRFLIPRWNVGEEPEDGQEVDPLADEEPPWRPTEIED